MLISEGQFPIRTQEQSEARNSSVTEAIPIRYIPFDILWEIALFSHPTIPVPTLSQLISPFLGVCSTWREAALSTPQIWSTLYLQIGRSKSLNAAAVTDWFGRAKDYPKILYLEFLQRGPMGLTALYADITRFFNDISSLLTCLRHLGLSATHNLALKSYLDPPLNWDVSELQQLDVHFHNDISFHGNINNVIHDWPLGLFLRWTTAMRIGHSWNTFQFQVQSL